MAGETALSPSLDAAGEPLSTFERKVDNGALLDFAPAIFPVECDVHHEIESPKTFAAFRRTPHDHEANAWEDALHAIARLGRELDRLERSDLETKSFGVAVALRFADVLVDACAERLCSALAQVVCRIFLHLTSASLMMISIGRSGG